MAEGPGGLPTPAPSSWVELVRVYGIPSWHPGPVEVREHTGVWWARKDQIAQWILDHPDTAIWADRDPAPVSGLPGRSS